MKRFLLKHVGNMGDMVFFVPPVLETLKRKYPDCHITFVTPWGFKDKKSHWGKRNQDGFSIALMMTNPYIDQLVHWHDTKLSLEGKICYEDGRNFPTWNQKYFDKQKKSGGYDGVWELDFGLAKDGNPLQQMYEVIHLPDETYSNYQLYFTEQDRAVAEFVMKNAPRPRIVLLEGLDGTTTRGWDTGKIPVLTAAIKKKYRVAPVWFGGKYVSQYHGRPLRLRENIATLLYCDVALGVLSGPLHFAAATGLPTLTLFADQPLRRAAPGYFLNPYIADEKKKHRTLIGPATLPHRFLKNDKPALALTPAEAKQQGHRSWLLPGRQSTKTGLATISVEEIMVVLADMLE